MADFQIPILNNHAIPDSTGDVFWEPAPIKATNDLVKHTVLVFNDTSTEIGIYGIFRVPENYSTSPSIEIAWTSTATSGDVEWDFSYRAIGGNDTESLDPSTWQETINQNDTAPSAAQERMTVSLSLTAGNFAVGDDVPFFLKRDGTDAGDTMAAAAIVHGVYFKYADS